MDYQQEFNHKYITAAELGSLFNFSIYQISRLRNAGVLPGVVEVGGRNYVFVREVIVPAMEEYLNKGRKHG